MIKCYNILTKFDIIIIRNNLQIKIYYFPWNINTCNNCRINTKTIIFYLYFCLPALICKKEKICSSWTIEPNDARNWKLNCQIKFVLNDMFNMDFSIFHRFAYAWNRILFLQSSKRKFDIQFITINVFPRDIK